ncbi:SF0329 family protein [Longimicrobium sp.]|uniref:SF0329 family protein n=1 Tax=Longimicrobium sp. TaxID=2029185 RepID=UPI003B3B0179
MRWSQLKHQVEARFAPSLQGRVQVWAAVYRKPATTDGRGWITLDGEQIHSMADIQSDAARAAQSRAIEAADAAEPGSPESDWTRGMLFGYGDFLDALECCLHNGIDDLLASPWPLNRALAMLDRRVGKRRFLRLERMDVEHPLVQRLYRIRAEAEGWPDALAVPSSASSRFAPPRLPQGVVPPAPVAPGPRNARGPGDELD